MESAENLTQAINRKLQELECEAGKGTDAVRRAPGGHTFISPIMARTDPQSQRPVMLLSLPRLKDGVKLHSLFGNLIVDGDEVSFLAQTVQGEEVELLCLEFERELLPLLDALDREEYELALLGGTKKEGFCVYEIHRPGAVEGIMTAPAFDRLDDGHLQALIKILLGRQEEQDGLPLFSTPEELRFLYRVRRHTLPPAIRKWAGEMFARMEAPGQSNTDKRPMHRALGYVLNIDWNGRPPDVPEISVVRKQLDRRLHGLDTVKQRICEAAAQIRRTGALPKWGILLTGAPGVGKTTIANAIAEVLGMPKAYIELATVHDAEALAGTSRIYENGKPGLILERLYAARTANLVMVLNEIDKADASAGQSGVNDVLLPLLDGMGFTDVYIEIPVPTGGIFFIATANSVSGLSRPLLDRFIQIDIPAYTIEEKKIIFNQYILPQAMAAAQLEPKELVLSGEASDCLFRNYALEPGIRDLERAAQQLVTRCLLEKEERKTGELTYSAQDLRRILGPAQRTARNYTMRSGMAFSAYVREGGVSLYAFQAAVCPARGRDGRLELINVESQRQQENCRLAYEGINLFLGNRLRGADVVLAAPHPLVEDGGNYTGCAAWAAILSALARIEYAPEAVFLGGVDLYGLLYLDEKTLDPYIRQLEQGRVIYGAPGISKQIYESHSCAGLSIVEAPSAPILCELASAVGKRL